MEEEIRITHYVNPHMFWYKPVSAYVNNLAQKRFQLTIDEYCEEHSRKDDAEAYYDSFPGEIVAVLVFEWNKWCRCIIDEVIEDGSGEKRYHLWAIDEGVPIQSSSRFIRPLPKKFSEETKSVVKRGSIKNVLPSEFVYDHHEDKLVSKVVPRWESNAVAVLQSIIQNGTRISFRNITKHMIYNDLVNFGELEITTHKKNVFNATKVLLDMRQACEVEPRDFINKLSTIQTMSVYRWATNEGMKNIKNSDKQAKPNEARDPQYERNGYAKLSNGTGRDGNIHDLELNGVSEEDFDESASMINPNKPRARASYMEENNRSHHEEKQPNRLSNRNATANEPAHSDQRSEPKHVQQPIYNHNNNVEFMNDQCNDLDELYPLSSPRIKAGENRTYERQLLQQQPRLANPKTLESIGLNKFNPKPILQSDNDQGGPAPQKPMSFLTKLQMIQRRVALKHAIAENNPAPSSPSLPNKPSIQNLDDSNQDFNNGNYDSSLDALKKVKPSTKSPTSPMCETKLNLIPAGFQLDKVGKMMDGDSSGSERKSKDGSRSYNKPSANRQEYGSNTSAPYRSAEQKSGYSSGGEPSKVYMTKNLSRFDRLIEEEACIRSKLFHHRLLVHGTRIPKPVEKLEHVNFCPEIHRQLSMFNFSSIQRIQTYAWPHILRGNSFFCVNSAGTGKTFAYIPAICSSIMKMSDEELVSKAAGPIAIVICKSSREVQRVSSFCRNMLNASANKAMTVVEAYGARDIPKACNRLLNGCAILVATASGFRRVHENMPNAFCKERIQSVVIDNIDSIIERFGTELQTLCKLCDKPELQMVVTANYWNPLFHGFLTKYKNMIVCIGAYLEAAIYGKSELVLKLNTREMKINDIVHFVKEHNYHSERTLIVCSSPAEVYQIVEELKSQSITHVFCSDSTVLSKMDGFKEWDNQVPGELHVLVCYDDILPDLEIRKAQHIIHYSLPKTWTLFTRRFACSFGYYVDPFREESSKPQKPASSLVLLDEDNNEQLPKLVEFLRIHNHEVADPIVKLANNIRIRHEETKLTAGNNVEFCPQMLDFGKCRSAGCVKRHVFTTRDLAEPDMPTSGVIKMRIYNMFSPTHYTARVLEHREYGAKNWTTVNDAQDFLALDLEMQQYYSNDERHCNHGEPHHGDWCVIFDEHRYWRCRIISIDYQKKENSTVKKVKVKLVDIGRTFDCVSSELLHIPTEFCRLPAQAIDIRIVGVVPHDFEVEWDKRVTATIKEWIHKYTANEKFHVEGKVLLAVRETIWVDTVRLVERLEGINTEIHEIHVKSEIVGKNFGVTDHEPLELLAQMVENCEAYKKRYMMEMADGKSAGDDAKEADDRSETSKASSEAKCVAYENQINGVDSTDNEAPFEGEKEVDRQETLSSESSQYFRGEVKHKEIDDAVERKPLLRPMEITDSESDDCDSECSNSKQYVPDNTVSSIEPVEQNIPADGSESITLAMDKLKIQSHHEHYDELDEEVPYEVFISQYYGADDFYVCRVEKFTSISSVINNYCKTGTNLIPLKDTAVGDYCLVFYDNAYQRSKVIQIEGRDIRVFFLDLGGYDTYTSVDLFELPEDLLKASTFCAIKAEVACLKPYANENLGWSSEVSDKIYDEVLCNYKSFMAKIITHIKAESAEPLVNCKRYRLLLFDPEHELESWIFDEIVELKLGRYIDEEKPYAIDINFGDDDFLNFLDPNKSQKKRITNYEPAVIEEIVEPKLEVVQPETNPNKHMYKFALLKQRLRKKKAPNAIVYPRLKCDFRSPKTIWRQDDSLVVIRVAAPENVQYDLVVDHDALKLCFLQDDEKYLLSVTFFASIIPDLAVHEVRGLSIVIRLVKLVQTRQWPSLMRHGDRVPWLQQCIEVPQSDETDVTEGMYLSHPTVPILDLSDDSLSDEPDHNEQYDRFDPIEDDYFMKDD